MPIVFVLFGLAARPASGDFAMAAERSRCSAGDRRFHGGVGFGSTRPLHDIDEFQSAAVSRDHVTALETQRIVIAWTGLDNAGRLPAFVYRNGSFGAIITPAGVDGEIVFNTFGAFVCPGCSPR